MSSPFTMPGDELGPCPCGHRMAMCHRANAQRYCPPLASEASAAEGRFPNPEPAGVGEARPAEPPTECYICHRPRNEPGEIWCSAGHPVGAPAEEQPDAREERLRVIEAVTTLMSTASLPWYEIDNDALVPHSNGYSCWFVSKEQAGPNPLGTAPLTDEEILKRVERLLAARAALGVVAKAKLPSVDDHPGYDGDK